MEHVEGNPVNLTDPTGKWICTADSKLFNPDCVDWVEDALHKLENLGGVPGGRLVDFFHRHDSAVKWSTLGCIVSPGLFAGRIWGIRITFNPIIPNWIGGQAMTIPPQDIVFDSTKINGATATLEQVTTFGHEISHLEQGLAKWFSVQSEMLSAILTYRLATELGAPHHPEGEDIRIGQGTAGDPQPYDPWSDADLQTFKEQWHLPYPLRPLGGDLPKDWLDQWGVAPF